MIYISAGHWNGDPGAIGSGTQENKEMMLWRDLVVSKVRSRGYKVVTDVDSESLSAYLNRIKPGDASVVVEYHLNAAASAKAGGTESVVPKNFTQYELNLGRGLSKSTSDVLGVPMRGKLKDGIITETETARKSLALMRELGTVVLHELVFISNPTEMSKFRDPVLRDRLAELHANEIIKAEDAIK